MREFKQALRPNNNDVLVKRTANSLAVFQSLADMYCIIIMQSMNIVK